jgi:flagellar L-ring protein precursor FlgH
MNAIHRNWINRFAGLGALAILAGCASVPPTNVHQPMTARAATPQTPPANGSIYQAGYAYRPLFEDRRARNVGDTLTIAIVEKNSASKNVSSKASRKSSVDVSVPTPTIFGYTPTPSGLGVAGITRGSNFDTTVSGSGDQSFEGKGDSSQKNDFSGTITVTVIEVLPNGNLLVSGEKQMGFNEGTEYVRFSGVVNPVDISGSNTVLSTRVADARLEFKGRGEMDLAQSMGWMTRFFLSVLPF